MTKFTTFPEGFKVVKHNLLVALFPEQAKTKDDSDRMMENSQVYYEMLLAAQVLAVDKTPIPTVSDENAKQPPVEPVVILMAGDNFKKFVEEMKKYLDQDALILRSLGLSRQDFDEIVNEYRGIVESSNILDDILTVWSDLPLDAKKSIIRGIMLQRSIMADVLNRLKDRELQLMQYETDTIGIINQTLNEPAHDQENKGSKKE